jgi:hypothetical protein
LTIGNMSISLHFKFLIYKEHVTIRKPGAWYFSPIVDFKVIFYNTGKSGVLLDYRKDLEKRFYEHVRILR